MVPAGEPTEPTPIPEPVAATDPASHQPDAVPDEAIVDADPPQAATPPVRDSPLAASALAIDTPTGGSGGLSPLLISLLIAIGLLALASAPPALARRTGGLAASAFGLRLEIAVGGALLLLLSAIGFFLTG